MRRLLLGLIAGVILISGTLAVVAMVYLRAQALQTGERLTASFAQVIEEQTSRTLQTIDQQLQLATDLMARRRATGPLSDAEVRSLLREQIRELPFLRAVWVLDAQGRLVYGTDAGNIGDDLSDRAYFQVHRSAPQTGFYIDSPTRSRTANTWQIVASRLLTASDGGFAGVIVAALEHSYFEKLWSSVDLGGGGSVGLMRSNGEMLVRSPFDASVLGRNFKDQPLFSNYLATGPAGNFQQRSPIDGHERQYAYRTLGLRPDMLVTIGQSRDLMLAPWRHLAAVALFIWGVASVALVVLSRQLLRVWRQGRQFDAERLEATQRLVMAEEERLGMFDRITDAFVALDRNFCYTHVNRLAAQLMGRDPSVMVGQHMWTIFPSMADHPLRHAMETALARQEPVIEEFYVPTLGCWFQNHIYPSPDGLTVYFHDVSARRLAEERLRQSEESLSITLQSIGDAVIATDIDGLITRMNLTAERLTGWPKAEAIGRPLGDVFRIINAQTRAPVPNPVELVLARGEVVGLANHTALLARDGAEYQIADSGAPIRNCEAQIVGVVLVFSDVTEAYRVREALATTVELLERTGEMAKVGGWEFDLRTQRVFWTRETCRIHDVDADGAPPVERALDFYPPEARGAVQAALQAGIEHGTPWDLEVPLVTAKGRRIWVRTQGFAMEENGVVVQLRGAFHDITERRQAEDDLRAASQRTQTILDNMTDGVITIDAQGLVESFNLAASRMFGYAAEEVLGRDVTMLLPVPVSVSVHDRDRRTSFLPPQADAGSPEASGATRELEGLRKDGSVFPMSLSVTRNPQSGQACYIGVLRDITQQRADMEEIRRLAFFDLLTGLPNRRLLMDRLRQAMTTSARSGQHGALMLLDLDHFKLLNDSAGHDVGDVLLQQVAARLQACVRECDSVARLGGDEFVVLLEGLSTHDQDAAAQAEIVANKILEAFKTPFVLRTQLHDGTTSIGIVVFKGDQVGMDDLIKKADVAMYQAKSAGRRNARFFDPAMQAAVAAHEALEKDLRRGIAMREFVLYYQVQVDGQGRVIGAEALVRWNHPMRGLVTPVHFISLAEETGLILPLGQWVLETACAQLVSWTADPVTAQWTVAVNVSAPQFAQANFVEHVAQAVLKAGANPRLLKLELTESMLVGDMEDVVRKMNQIKSQGVGFSLDDFGTGYSSLSYLKRLPLDQLKIDQSFVRDVLGDASDAVIARTIVALGQSLGMMVIAEGVETAEQRDFLVGIGCDGFQGYFFGRPGAARGLQLVPDKLI